MYNILKMIEKPWISLLVTAHLSISLSIYGVWEGITSMTPSVSMKLKQYCYLLGDE